MRDDQFQELMQAIEEMGAWLRGEDIDPSRVIFVGEPDPRQVRAELGMTREAFAAALCITPEALRGGSAAIVSRTAPPRACSGSRSTTPTSSGTPPRERMPVRSLYPLPRSLWERVRALASG